MFYPPEGLCWAEPEGGPIVFTFHFIGVGRGTGGFKIRIGNPPFWNLENVLFDGVGGWVGWWVDGVSNGSLIFLHTLWVYRTCIGVLIYTFKICHQLCYGFESFMSSWGSGSKISNLQQVGDVSFFRSKSSLFFSPPLGRPFLRKNTNFLFFCIKDFTKDFTNDFVGRLF